MDPTAATIQYVRVNHRRPDVLVPQELLYGPDVVTVLQKMGGKGMAKRVGGHVLGQPSLSGCLMDCLLNDRFVQVVTMRDSGLSVDVMGRRGEDPLSAPRAIGVWILPRQGVR